jgi:hypothetical protein
MRIQVFSRVDAEVTVRETVCANGQQSVLYRVKTVRERLTSILPLAHSRLETTPSMTSLMLRTPSSSFCKRVLRFCSVSYLETPLREWAVLVLSEGIGAEGLVCLEVRDGDANRSSASDESSERPSLPIFRVAMLMQVNAVSVQ